MLWRGLEPRRLAAPPPQDGVSTNFTTRARGPVIPNRRNTNCTRTCKCTNTFEPGQRTTGATGLEPATSRVTVECSNQTELRPQHQHLQPQHRELIAPTGVEPVSQP